MKKVLLTITLLLSFASTQPCHNDIENTNCLIATGLIGDLLVGGGITASIIGFQSMLALASTSSNGLCILGATGGMIASGTASLTGCFFWNLGKYTLFARNIDLS